MPNLDYWQWLGLVFAIWFTSVLLFIALCVVLDVRQARRRRRAWWR